MANRIDWRPLDWIGTQSGLCRLRQGDTVMKSRLYDYLVALILLAILICGIIYAALGIKLLFGI